ncbi:DUF4293 domain-containing protein [Porphyromonas somerae]|uniref:DUF4293 domain-containing protein n=1 Tax=Porphyromonas somerae TaxID=322095 RepID=UPI002A75837C|nr:DUF4293 domain-containing protein [Porphyromonas somerae]MDY3119557.1 DUF4293 domain-containing protein [Porphyromonas somerae]
MIQRKQTLYLLASGLLMLAMLFLTFAKVTTQDMVYAFKATGLEDLSGEIVQPSWVLFGLTAAITLISFISIFLYRKRILQMRLTIFNLLIKVGFYLLVFVVYRPSFIKSLVDTTQDWSMSITPWLAFPIVAMIFDYLAYRGIAVDEKTIRFMDRLR